MKFEFKFEKQMDDNREKENGMRIKIFVINTRYF